MLIVCCIYVLRDEWVRILVQILRPTKTVLIAFFLIGVIYNNRLIILVCGKLQLAISEPIYRLYALKGLNFCFHPMRYQYCDVLNFPEKLILQESSTHKKPFQRSHLDDFKVDTYNLGEINKLRLVRL